MEPAVECAAIAKDEGGKAACGGDGEAAATAVAARHQFSALVAHRALFGARRRRAAGRKAGAGDKPVQSRLSKVSDAAKDAK
ncbi:hypothetical protein ZIOFF_010784 [Zingiber officinale]|uniref:Uncharacterized protein n=1 Tax=Zingiber officinale TaxID=94328 RepID=A0A8J5LPK7_ZINOF|nr:hypothetical protein ZIOFF_010784 [Zingiber officinale]